MLQYSIYSVKKNKNVTDIIRSRQWIWQANSPLSHHVSTKQNYTAILKANSHEVEIFVNSQTCHLQKSTFIITERNEAMVKQSSTCYRQQCQKLAKNSNIERKIVYFIYLCRAISRNSSDNTGAWGITSAVKLNTQKLDSNNHIKQLLY